MRALWLENRSLAPTAAAPEPRPRAGEAVVGVRLAGICNTDLELLAGYYPYAGVPGHEFVGRVEAAPGREEWVGERVVGEINAACGECATCRAARRTHCERRTVLGILGRDGAFAERLSLPVVNLHRVPEHLSDEEAVFTEPLAAALEIQEQVAIAAADRVLVLGPGKLGTLVARSLALTGCELVVAGRRSESLARLRLQGLETTLADALPAGGFDVAVECTGRPEGFALARRAVRPRGTIVLKSTYRGETSLDLSAVVVAEITLVGSRCGPFGKALELLASGRVAVGDLVDARYALDDGLAAFEHAARPGALKVLLRP